VGVLFHRDDISLHEENGKYFIKYNSGLIVPDRRKLEITKQEAEDCGNDAVKLKTLIEKYKGKNIIGSRE
jgi:hypothetical protein